MSLSAISPLSDYNFANSSEFIVGTDDFENLEITTIEETGYHYIKDKGKPLSRYIRHFVLKQGKLSKKVCAVTLIKNKNDHFEPRLDFKILSLTKGAAISMQTEVVHPEDRTVKARVNLADCHENLALLLAFFEDCKDIQITENKYAVITKDKKKILDNVLSESSKELVLETIGEKYGHTIDDKDIAILTKRKSALGRFKKLLDDKGYFQKYIEYLESKNLSHRREDVWQHFFEHNSWIFGYGLQLVACESLDNRKLETIVVGSDIFDGAGKRIDGLLKTKGSINRSLFTEIKLHDAMLMEKYDRPAVWSPAKELRGAIGQMHKTLHKVNLKVSQNFHEIKGATNSLPTGEKIAFVKPRGIVIIGTLDQFVVEHGFDEEQFASFELYRQQQNGVDIVTFDELYERARFIVE